MKCLVCGEPIDAYREAWFYVTRFTDQGLAEDSLYAHRECCDDGVQTKAKQCPECCSWYANNDFAKQLGACPFCFKICTVCSDTFGVSDFEDEQDYAFRNEDTDELYYVCSDCGKMSLIRAYDDDVLDYLEFFGNGPRYLGVELELTLVAPRQVTRYMQGLDLVDKASKGWAVMKHDGSLPSYSMELVSAPADLSVHTEKWNGILQNISPYFTGDNSSCGMHIHISRELPAKLEWKLLNFMHDSRNADFFSSIGGRDIDNDWGREFCPQFGNHWARSKYRIRGGRVVKHTQVTEHHSAVAIAGDTLEFRIFQSTTKYEGIMANLQFVNSLYDYIRTDCSIMNNSYRHYLKWLLSHKGNAHLKKRLFQQKINKEVKVQSASSF